jgi:basic membrane protein A
MKPAVNDVVTAAAKGNFDPAPYLGTLKNGGVGIAPFHDYKSKVAPSLQGELDKIKASIISGDIKVKSYLAAS